MRWIVLACFYLSSTTLAAAQTEALPGAALYWQANARIPFLKIPNPLVDFDGDDQPDRIEWQQAPGLTEPHRPWQLLFSSANGQRQAVLASGDPWLSPPGLFAAPHAIAFDVNTDGRQDLILAWDKIDRMTRHAGPYPGYRPADSWNPWSGEIAVAYNRGVTDDRMVFSSLRNLPIRGEEPRWPSGSHPLLFDLDSDNRRDLLVANGRYGLHVLLCVGSRKKPTFLDVGLIDDENDEALQGRTLARCAILDDKLVASDREACCWRTLQAAGHLARKVGPVLLRPVQAPEPIAGPFTGLTVVAYQGAQYVIAGLRDGSLQSMTIQDNTCTAPVPLQFHNQRAVYQACEVYGDGSPRGPVEWGNDWPRPQACDWNGDGIPDLMVGGLGRRMLWYRGLASNGIWRLATPVTLRMAGGPLICPMQQPAIDDMDGDGHPDLIAIDANGLLRTWRGQGNATIHMGEAILDSKGNPITFKQDGICLDFCDADSDGSQDLLTTIPGRGLVYRPRRALGRFADAHMLLPAKQIDGFTIHSDEHGRQILLSLQDHNANNHLRRFPLADAPNR